MKYLAGIQSVRRIRVVSIPYAPWCWNIYQHLPYKSPSFVGKYTIHGAYRIDTAISMENHHF